MEGSKFGMHAIDYVIFAVILIVSIGIGLFFAFRGRGQQTTNEFLMGSRKLSTFPVAVSIFVSVVSGISFLGHPAEMYTQGTQYYAGTYGFILALPIKAITFVPLFFRLQITSAFEYLEARYQSKYVKLYGSVLTLLQLVMYSGIVLYAPAVALEAINNFPLWLSILLSSAVTVAYTTLGGMKAVIYTDVFQSCCMIAGLIAIVVQGTRKVGGFGRVWEISQQGGRLQFFNFDPNPTLRTSFWITFIGAFFAGLEIDQTTFQRTNCLPTLRKAKCSLLLHAVFFGAFNTILTFAGLVIYAYYAELGCDPLQAKYITSQNHLVPYFIRDVLSHPGISGALFAVLLGGTLSTVSSNLNAAATIAWQDIFRYYFENLSESRKTSVTKILMIAFGVMSTIFAFLAKYMANHVLQVFITVMGIFLGPMLGMFLLGALFPFANNKGAMTGSLAAAAFNTWIALGSIIYNPHAGTLPTSVEKCNTTSNMLLFMNNSTDEYYSEEFFNRSILIGSFNASGTSLNWTFDESIQNATRTDSISNPLIHLYSISFYLFGCIGTLNAIIIGVIVSLLTGGIKQPRPDAKLMLPIFDRLCCCLPEKFRRHLRCGIEYNDDDKGQTEDTLVTNGLLPADEGSKPIVCNAKNIKESMTNSGER